MQIKAVTNFKHGDYAYQSGASYEVADALGCYFVGVGWATDLSGVFPTGTDPGPKVITPENVTIESKTGGVA